MYLKDHTHTHTHKIAAGVSLIFKLVIISTTNFMNWTRYVPNTLQGQDKWGTKMQADLRWLTHQI